MTATPLEPALVKIERACRYLDVGRTKIYRLIHEGKLDCVRTARITTESLKKFVESLPSSSGGSPIKRKLELDELGNLDTTNAA
jgi:excisionase family DNA binding protein